MLTLLVLLGLGALLGQALMTRRELLRRLERMERELARQRTELEALRSTGREALPPGPETVPAPAPPEPEPARSVPASQPAPPHQDGPFPRSIPRRLPEARSVFAVGGAVLTLLGLGFVLSQLQSAGLLTPQVQLAAAFALAAALYALSGRVGGVVGQMLRGLGYGVAALCLGAMFQAGALAPVSALALTALLGAAVGAHALHRGELPAVAVALGGTTLAVWLLADDLARDLGGGGMLPAQLALLAVTLATLLVARRAGRAAAPLLVLLPTGMVGLLVSGEHHGQAGEPALWLVQALLPGALLTGWTWRGTAAGWAAGALLGALWVAGLALLAAPGALLALALGGVGLFAAATPIGRRAPLGQAAVLGALLAGGLWVLALWGERADLPLRLLPLALASALYGTWTGARTWRRISASLAASLLLWSGAAPLPVALLAAAAGGAGGLLLGGRAGAVVLGAAALAAGLGWSLGTAALALAAALLGLAWWSARLPPVLVSRTGALAGAGALLALGVLLNAAPRGLDTLPALVLASGAALLLAATLRGEPGQALAQLWRLPRPLPARVGELLACALWLLGVGLALPEGAALWGLSALAAALALTLGLAGARLPALLAALAGLGLLGGLLAPLAPDLASGVPAWLGGAALLTAWSGGRVGMLWPRGLLPLLPPARELAMRWGLAVALAFAGAELLARSLPDGYLATLPGTAALLLPGLLALGLGQRRGLAGVWCVGLAAFGLGAARLVLDAEGLGLAAQGLGLTVVGLLLLAIGQLAPGLRRGPAGG